MGYYVEQRCKHRGELMAQNTYFFHDGGRYHIETRPLICIGLSMDWFLYDNGLRHERVEMQHHNFF